MAQCPAAGLLNLTARLFDQVRTPPGGNHVRAVFRQAPRNHPADAGRSADHYGYAVRQVQAAFHFSGEGPPTESSLHRL